MKNFINTPINKIGLLEQKITKIEMSASELGEQCFFLALEKAKQLFDDRQLMKKLGIKKTADSVQEIHILCMFSIVNFIKDLRFGNEIKDSIINYMIDCYIDILSQSRQRKRVNEQALLGNSLNLKKLIFRRFTQYSKILNNYTMEAMKCKNPSSLISLKTGGALINIFQDIISHTKKKDLMLKVHFFSLFLGSIMDEYTSDTIYSYIQNHDIIKNELSGEMKSHFGDDSDVIKEAEDTNKKNKSDNDVNMALNTDLEKAIKMMVSEGEKKGFLTYYDVKDLLPISITTEDQIDIIVSALIKNRIVIIDNEGQPDIQSHVPEYLEFLIAFFTDYEDIKTEYTVKSEPNNLSEIINFAFFLDIATNLPWIFTEHLSIDMKNAIHHYMTNSVNTISELTHSLKKTQIDQTIERLMFYAQLLSEDLKNRDNCNYQSIHEFLKEVFSGQITQEDKTVLTNILTRQLPAIKSLIMMQTSLE